MSVLIEAMIGDAHVSVTNDDYRARSAHHTKMALATPASGTPDAAAVAAFIRPCPDFNRRISTNSLPGCRRRRCRPATAISGCSTQLPGPSGIAASATRRADPSLYTTCCSAR